jgi:hypothetical protein
MHRSGSLLAVIACVALMPSAWGCSLVRPETFVVRKNAAGSGRSAPPEMRLVDVDFVPSLSSDPNDSCMGTGFLSITIDASGKRAGSVARYGYYLRPKSGVHNLAMFPDHPMKPLRSEGRSAVIFWGWYGISPDADGHVRWRLELVPVTRSGREGQPLEICVSTDDSCPRM